MFSGFGDLGRMRIGRVIKKATVAPFTPFKVATRAVSASAPMKAAVGMMSPLAMMGKKKVAVSAPTGGNVRTSAGIRARVLKRR